MTYDSITFIFKKNDLSRFLPKIFPGYPQAWNACYRNIKRHFLLLSSQECCSQQLTHERQHAERHVTDAACFKRFFPAGFIQGSESTCCISITIQPDSHFRLISIFFLDSFSGQLAVMYELSVLENKCLQWCPWSVLLEYTPTSSTTITSQSESSLWAYLCSGVREGHSMSRGGDWFRGRVEREKEGEMEGWFRNSVHLYLRGENQRLQDVWERDDALDAGVIIHHDQPVHLQDTHTSHKHSQGPFHIHPVHFHIKKKTSQNNLNEHTFHIELWPQSHLIVYLHCSESVACCRFPQRIHLNHKKGQKKHFYNASIMEAKEASILGLEAERLVKHLKQRSTKIYILSLITRPHVVPNLQELRSSWEHKSRYSDEIWALWPSTEESKSASHDQGTER